MASRSQSSPKGRGLRPSFKWRVLIPSLGLMWLIIFVLAAYQYNREETVRSHAIEHQMDMLTSNVIAAYGKGMDIADFVEFIQEFYDRTNYDGVRLSVYSYDGSLVAAVGRPLSFSYKDYGKVNAKDAPADLVRDMTDDPNAFDNRLFYFTSEQTTDGRLVVLTAMPFTTIIDESIDHRNAIWLVILPLMLVATVVVYILVAHLSKGISLLSQFASDVAEGRPFDATEEFPHDEFGDISRQLIRLYNDKDRAMEEREKEHRVALNAIMEKGRFKREMTNNVNHELKTPVGIVKGYIDTIMASKEMDAETMRHFLGRAQSNVDRLCNLINDLSVITRLEDGAGQIPMTRVEMHDLVYTLADDYRSSGLLGQMTFDFDIPLDCMVIGNESLIQGIVNNLTRNAARHSRGTEIHFELAARGDRFCTFRFYDNGTGVPEESVSKLFDRFYRVDKGRSRKMGDTGLGLSIVDSSVTAMGGAISVKNRSTGGLEFTFTIPVWTSETVKKDKNNDDLKG